MLSLHTVHTCTHGTYMNVTTGNPFSGVKNEFWENKTVKSYFSCLLSSLLGFRVVLEPFLGFFDLLPLTTLKKREGWTVAKHVWFYSVTLTSGKFCFGRAKWEYYMYFIILSQLKWNRSFSHGAWARKTSMFRHFECVPPSTVTPFSPKNNSTSSRGAGQILFLFTCI